MINRPKNLNSASLPQAMQYTTAHQRNYSPKPANPHISIWESQYSHNITYCYLIKMKERFREGLEKLVKAGKDIGRAVKKNVKIGLITLALPFIMSNNAGAGALGTYCRSSLTTPSMGILHKTGATEGYDTGYDALFLSVPWDPTIDFYTKISSPPPEDRLMRDARPLESMTTINAEISGRGITSPESANLEFKWGISSGIGNFSWKNIIGELSQRGDDGEGSYKYTLINNYDIKHMVNSATTIPISVENGITQGDTFFPSHKLDYNFFHYCDLNRDRQIDRQDFDIFARNWGREGIVKGSNPNDVNDYADIADVYDGSSMVSYGDGKVDCDE